jgi:hypothetical protein
MHDRTTPAPGGLPANPGRSQGPDRSVSLRFSPRWGESRPSCGAQLDVLRLAVGETREQQRCVAHRPVLEEHHAPRQRPARLTSSPDMFAAGDIRAGAMNRVASAVGEGSMAVRLVREYLALTRALARASVSAKPSAGGYTTWRSPSARVPAASTATSIRTRRRRSKPIRGTVHRPRRPSEHHSRAKHRDAAASREAGACGRWCALPLPLWGAPGGALGAGLLRGLHAMIGRGQPRERGLR